MSRKVSLLRVFHLIWLKIYSRSHKSLPEREWTWNPESHAATIAEKAECWIYRNFQHTAEQCPTKQLLTGLDFSLLLLSLFQFFNALNFLSGVFGVVNLCVEKRDFEFSTSWVSWVLKTAHFKSSFLRLVFYMKSFLLSWITNGSQNYFKSLFLLPFVFLFQFSITLLSA